MASKKPKRAEETPADPEPTLEEMKHVFLVIPEDADVVDPFAKAFANGETDLFDLRNALLAEDPKNDALILEVTERALRSPSCRWPDTHWRPYRVEALVRLERMDEAREEIARVVAGANSYDDTNWKTILQFLDALGRKEDADAIFRAARRYVTGSFERRDVPRADRSQKDRVASVLLELAAPALAAAEGLDEEALSHAAHRFENLVKEGVASDALLPEAKRLRKLAEQRADRGFVDGLARLQRGEALGESELKDILAYARRSASDLQADDAERLARAACAFPSLIPWLENVAYECKDANVESALRVYRAVVASPPPAAELGGQMRRSWLQTVNAALVVKHAQKLFEESARLADAAAPYAHENPYITHSAACSYAAVGRYDDALAQVKLAVELAYPHLDKVQKDTDLGPLLEREEFRALFGKRQKPRAKKR